MAIEALHRGAVDFIDKKRYSLVDFAALGDLLIETILEVTVVSPQVQQPASAAVAKAPAAEVARQPESSPRPSSYDLVVIGASTGGPPAVQQVFHDLGRQSVAPVVVVQHMPVGFTRAFADRLNASLSRSVREAEDGEHLLPATAYIAPAGVHLELARDEAGLLAKLVEEPARLAHRPSVDVLFGSAARVVGDRTVAVLLTGMGTDGAQGMSELAAAGAHTVVQDEQSSVIFGMPRAALERGAASETLPLRPHNSGRKCHTAPV